MDFLLKSWIHCSGQLLNSIGELCYSSSVVNRESLRFAALTYLIFPLGVESFVMYSVHEGIRGIPLDPNDKMEALMPISGTSFAVGIDFHAGKYSV